MDPLHENIHIMSHVFVSKYFIYLFLFSAVRQL